MATLPASGALPPARSNTSRASRTRSQAESSAARCQKLKLPNDEKLATTRTQPKCECTPAGNSERFQYSAGTPVSHVSTFANNTSGPEALSAKMNGRMTASYLHYLMSKMRTITSKVDSYSRELDRTTKQLCRKMSYRADKLCKFVTLIDDKCRYVDDNTRMFQFFSEIKDSYGADLKRSIDLLIVTNDSCALDIRRQLEKLMSKLAPFAGDLDLQIKMLNSKIATYTSAVEEKMQELNSHYSSCARAVERELGEFFLCFGGEMYLPARPTDFFFSID